MKDKYRLIRHLWIWCHVWCGKGHCHGDFATFSWKWLKYSTKNLFSNMKLLLEHREGNIKGDLSGEEQSISSFWWLLYNTQKELEKIAQSFQVVIHFHPSHAQPKIINTSFCALLGLLLTKLNHYFDDFIDSNKFFWLFNVTQKIGDTAPLTLVFPLSSSSCLVKQCAIFSSYILAFTQAISMVMILFFIFLCNRKKTCDKFLYQSANGSFTCVK